MKAGAPKGANVSKQLPTKKTYAPEVLLENIANRALGKPAPKGEITEKDQALLKRISGMSVEQFNEHLSAKLRRIADELADEILSRKSEIGANNLAFTLAVAADKLARLDGTGKLAGAAVNIQVNNYGDVDRETLIAQLSGRKPILANPATNLNASQPSPSAAPQTNPANPNPNLSANLPAAPISPPTLDLDQYDTAPPSQQDDPMEGSQ